MLNVSKINKIDSTVRGQVLADVTFEADDQQFRASVREDTARKERYGMPSHDMPVTVTLSDTDFSQLVGVSICDPNYDVRVEQLELEVGEALSARLREEYGIGLGTTITTFVANIDDKELLTL